MLEKKIIWQNNTIWLHGAIFLELEGEDALSWATDAYKKLGLSYIKFFKMDIVSKVGFLAAEILLKEITLTEQERTTTSVYVTTQNGCLDVDIKYQESMNSLASPALFVYTLPNIVLGEICIKQKFKGEQMCYVAPELDREDMHFYVKDIFEQRSQTHCLAGNIDAVERSINVELNWFTK